MQKRTEDHPGNNGQISPLDKDELAALNQQFHQETLQAGETLFRENDLGDRMYIVVEGKLEVLKKGKDGKDVKVGERGEGSLIGVMNLFYEDKLRPMTLRATEDSEVWSLDKDHFLAVLACREDLAFKFFAYVSNELREELTKRAAMLTDQADGRFKLYVFDAKKYEQDPLLQYTPEDIDIHFIESRLTPESVSMASGATAVCVFVNDEVDRSVIEQLASFGIELVALRCAGFNNVDLQAAEEFGVSVTRVPAYSPHAVAEHALALMMTLNRKTHRAYNRVREGNFYLNRLVGFDMYGRTAGIIGTGKIGKCMAEILRGIGMKVLSWDAYPDEAFAEKIGMRYVDLDTLFAESDIVSLHVPLLPETHHIINEDAIRKMKKGVMLINTSRGGLVHTKALIQALKTNHVGSAGLDVYEEEVGYFFKDYSGLIIDDDTLARLISFPNVLITSHQAFLTEDALNNIAETTLASVVEFKEGIRKEKLTYAVLPS